MLIKTSKNSVKIVYTWFLQLYEIENLLMQVSPTCDFLIFLIIVVVLDPKVKKETTN